MWVEHLLVISSLKMILDCHPALTRNSTKYIHFHVRKEGVSILVPTKPLGNIVNLATARNYGYGAVL